MTPTPERFDVALALRRAVTAFGYDFSPIVVLGFGMVLLPEIALILAGTSAGATMIAAFGGMLRVLYVVIVTTGILARLSGRPLAPGAFVRTGIALSPAGLSVALLLGAGVVMVLVTLLLATFASRSTTAIQAALVVAAFVASVPALAAVPAALVERLSPLTALRRSAALTNGHRGSIAAFVLIVGLAIVPARVVLAATVYGMAASAAQVAAIDATMTLASPGLWLVALVDLVAWGVAAVVPAVIYAGVTDS